MPTSSGLQFALRWAFGHFAVSLAAAMLSAALVFGLWYPDPWRQMLGVAGIFSLVIAVDVVCGPLLTLVLASPAKPRRELGFDLAVVALIQFAALGYGLWSVFSARPVVLAFEVDRLVVVTANEVLADQLGDALPGFQTLPWAGMLSVNTREAVSSDEALTSVELSMQGVTPAMQPAWWRPFADASAGIESSARPLSELLAKRPRQRNLIEDAVKKTGLEIDQLRYLPLTSSRQLDWVALVDDTGAIAGHAHVDGFD